MKKITAIILSFVILSSVFTACSQNNSVSESDEKISIVTTIFPEYDWVMQILGNSTENADVTMLLDSGVDLHSFQPTADDMITIINCDLFIYIGGESDDWVDDALNEADNENMQVLNLLDVLGTSAKEEKIVEGMQAEEEEHEEEEEETEYDEHIWLSLKNAQLLCDAIAQKLCEIDEKNAQTYTQNAQSYINQLETLDGEYQEAIETASKDTILFADRFPFMYLADDYSLNYYAAFVGCSAETEASFETIKFLSDKVDELGLDVVLTIENPTHDIAETVVENTESKNQQILSLNSMQSVTSTDVENGVTYFSIMQENLETLKTALA